MKQICIVGSGASGVHFALSLLRKGYNVVMLDAGHVSPWRLQQQIRFRDLRTELADPVEYFLGKNFEAVVFPDLKSEYYGIPPNKAYVFANVTGSEFQSDGFSPLFSFAKGGLAEAWSGGVYPFNDTELRDFPFSYNEIRPFYDEVTSRIGVTGIKDDLSKLMPLQEGLQQPLRLDEHSACLIAEYQKQKHFLNQKLRCHFGRSRVATLSQDIDGRQACSYLGRCLWGCPTQSLYTPSMTLKKCIDFPAFRYLPGLYISHFNYDGGHRITNVVAKSIKDQHIYELPVEILVLASGTLSSSRIFLESFYRNEGVTVKLSGLMDNRQLLIPFVNLKMIGKLYNPDTYKYQQLAFIIESDKPDENVHCIVTTLKSAMVHPIIQNTPLDLRSSLFIFRHIRSALGLVNVNFHDRRRDTNYVTLEVDSNTSEPRLYIKYVPIPEERVLIKDTVKAIKQILRKLKCIVPPRMIHVRPMGASVHYAGTIPMAKEKRAFTVSEYCQSRDFENLYIVDGSTFPFLPAKNITFTLMANAIRVAECAF